MPENQRSVKPRSECGNGWRPIDSAPKDGSSVLFSNGRKVWEDWWWDDENGWMYDSNWADHIPATHWQPLPEPPRSDDG